MLRLSRLARAQRCYYQILGVSRDAPTEDIKRAFQEKAKMTHPDVAKGGNAAPTQFREMVEAYRILRDPTKRSEYDREAGRERFRSPDQDSGHWPRGEGEGLSEEARAKLYNYPVGGGSRSRRGTPQYAEPRVQVTQGSWAPFAMMGAAGLLVVYSAVNVTEKKKQRDPDPYPSRLPAADAKAAKKQAAAAAAAAAAPANGSNSTAEGTLSASPGASFVAGTVTAPGVMSVGSATNAGFGESRPEDAEKMVWAYYNPFGARWQRIPEGFEPPASMDLTAWHKKQTDPVEWSRLVADGKLVDLIPRGGLKVRYRPAWDTYEPILLRDPVTQRTVQVTEKLLKSRSSGVKKECEVRF